MSLVISGFVAIVVVFRLVCDGAGIRLGAASMMVTFWLADLSPLKRVSVLQESSGEKSSSSACILLVGPVTRLPLISCFATLDFFLFFIHTGIFVREVRDPQTRGNKNLFGRWSLKLPRSTWRRNVCRLCVLYLCGFLRFAFFADKRS